MSTAHQVFDADKGPRRIVLMEKSPIDRIEPIKQRQISAVDRHRNEVVCGQARLLKGALYRLHGQACLAVRVGAELVRGRIDSQLP